MDTLGSWLGARVPVEAGDTLGKAVIGKSLKSVGDSEITFGKSLELEIGAVGPGDAVGISDKVGSALDKGANVELPKATVGMGDTRGC